MKRKLLIGIAAFAMLSGTAYAASSNIVSVLVNGKAVQSGQIIDGSTMLPLRAISEALGADVQWDNAKKQASITTAPDKIVDPPPVAGLSLEQLNKIGESVGLVYALDAAGGLLSTGSGFVIDNVFVTNVHVTTGATSLQIWFGNKDVTVTVNNAVFNDADADLIGFKVEGFPSVKLNTSTPNNKDKVYVLGYPHRKFTITEGFFVSNWNDDQWVHSAKTDSGASGGILINAKGEVIGVSTAALDGGGANMAIQAKVLQNELNN